MNLKERGVTVGDLIIILVFVAATLFSINKLKERNNQSLSLIDVSEIATTIN